MAYCVLHSGNEFLPETRASKSQSQPPCPTSMYLIHTLGVALGEAATLRTATKEGAPGTKDRTSEIIMATCEEKDGTPTRGAGRGRGVVIALARRGAIGGGIGIAPHPESVCWSFAQSGDCLVAAAIGVGAHMHGVECRRERGKRWVLSVC